MSALIVALTLAAGLSGCWLVIYPGHSALVLEGRFRVSTIENYRRTHGTLPGREFEGLSMGRWLYMRTGPETYVLTTRTWWRWCVYTDEGVSWWLDKDDGSNERERVW